MHPAVVLGVRGIVAVVVVVEHRQFIAHVDQRHPAEPADHGVQHVDATHRQVDGFPVLRLEGRLESGQGRQGAGNTPVAGGGVGLEHQAAGERLRELAGVEVRQESAVLGPVDADCSGVAVVDGPADVVVAAHVGAPGGRRGFRGEPFEGVAQQRHVATGQR